MLRRAIKRILSFGSALGGSKTKRAAPRMPPEQLAAELKRFLSGPYPEIEIEAKTWDEDPARLAIYFRHEKFAALYPRQRYHYLIHGIPKEFFDAHLADAVWFELAPGEAESDLEYPDEELIESIAPDVLFAVERAGVIARLDDMLAPESLDAPAEECHGDFRHLKQALAEKGFGRRGEIDEVFDICHVMMARGGYCDCEVLYNVFEDNRLKSRYWKKRAEGLQIEGERGPTSSPHN